MIVLLKGGGLFLSNDIILGSALLKPHFPFSSSRAQFLISLPIVGDGYVIFTGVE